jgi:hypothetical protein
VTKLGSLAIKLRTVLLVLALGGVVKKHQGGSVAKIIMKYQRSSYELSWQKKSDSSSDILAYACESVLRKCTDFAGHKFLESHKLLTLGCWSSVVHGAQRRFRRNSLLR